MTYASSEHGAGRESPKPLTICVFGGARPGRDPRLVQLAEQLGRSLGERGHGLVFGAGATGVMGAVARAAAQAGAEVTGIVPGWLRGIEGELSPHDGEVLLTDDLFDRKRTMLARADGFIALPGGYGTVDEILEVVSLNYLGRMCKPLAVVDADGCWNGLLRLFGNLQELGFADAVPLFAASDGVQAALEFVECAANEPATPTARSNTPVGA